MHWSNESDGGEARSCSEATAQSSPTVSTPLASDSAPQHRAFVHTRKQQHNTAANTTTAALHDSLGEGKQNVSTAASQKQQTTTTPKASQIEIKATREPINRVNYASCFERALFKFFSV